MKRSIIIAGMALCCGVAGAQAATVEWRDGQGPGSPVVSQPYVASHASARSAAYNARTGQGPGSFENAARLPYAAGDAPANPDVSKGGRTGQGPAARP